MCKQVENDIVSDSGQLLFLYKSLHVCQEIISTKSIILLCLQMTAAILIHLHS